MKRVFAVAMIAGLMSFGAIAGQSTKTTPKPATPSASAQTIPAQSAGTPVKTSKTHKKDKKHKDTQTTSTNPRN